MHLLIMEYTKGYPLFLPYDVPDPLLLYFSSVFGIVNVQMVLVTSPGKIFLVRFAVESLFWQTPAQISMQGSPIYNGP